jgi:DNA repair exonuclease SbcCD ATPase subunit
MLHLEELKFKNIGRFIDEQTINISGLTNFVQLDGKNNNTGGSSGSGKTTVAMALDYLLGVNHRAATILQSRYSEYAIWVQGTFTDGADNVIITRSKSLITVEKGGETFKGQRAEEIIDSILRIPRDLFRKIMHKRQREGGFFLSFTPKEMHDFLIDCIGLSTFKQKYEITERRQAVINESLDDNGADLLTHGSLLKATQDAILSLGMAPIQDMHKEVILELKTKADSSSIRFNTVQTECESLDREYGKKRPVLSSIQRDETIRENLEKRRDEIEAAIGGCFEKEKRRQEDIKQGISKATVAGMRLDARIKDAGKAKIEATRIAAEIMSIRSQACPTCKQKWCDENSALEEQKKLAEVTELKILITDGAKAQEEKLELEGKLVLLNERLQPIYDPKLETLNEELCEVVEEIIEEKKKSGVWYEDLSAENKKKMDDFTAAYRKLQDGHKILIDQARGQMDVDRRVLESAVSKLKAYTEAKDRYQRSFDELKAKENIYLEKTTKHREEIAKLEHEQKLNIESLKATKTFVSYSFDEALDAISEKATKIIRCIPNMSNATIQFEGTKETKDGRIKEEVNAILSMDGEATVPVKSLSGGELSATDLAIDLAVIDYIESRSGMGINVFILDEPFNGLGTVEIEMALEVLKNSNTNKKLIIVDHNPEVKQMVQSRLVVERTGLTSRVI